MGVIAVTPTGGAACDTVCHLLKRFGVRFVDHLLSAVEAFVLAAVAAAVQTLASGLLHM